MWLLPQGNIITLPSRLSHGFPRRHPPTKCLMRSPSRPIPAAAPHMKASTFGHEHNDG